MAALIGSIGLAPVTANVPFGSSTDASAPLARPAAASDRVIVTYRDGSAPDARAAARAQAGAQRVRGLGHENVELLSVPVGAVDAAIAALNRRPEVAFAEPDYVLQPDYDYAAEKEFPRLWGLHNTGQTGGRNDVDIDAPEAAALTLGDQDVVVAVIDDGVDFSHPDLAGRQWVNPGESGAGRESNGLDDDCNGYVDDVNGWDFYNDDNTVHDPADGDEHGTHVAGTVAASLNGSGIVGVAPNVRIMALKFLGPTGGSTSDAIMAIRYAAAQGIGISNNSWGGPATHQALSDAIAASGMLFVASAGNGGGDDVGDNNDVATEASYPASYPLPNILSVAAIANTGSLGSFSNYGATSVDISAPGVGILSTVPGGGWASWSGTSMAAPHATGVAALAASVNPALLGDPTALRQLIMDQGKPAPSTSGKTVTGDIVDADAVVNAAPSVATTAAAGRPAAGGVQINGGNPYTNDPIVTVATPPAGGAGIASVRLSNGGGNWKVFPYTGGTQSWSLSDPAYGGSTTNGPRQVCVQWGDAAGRWSPVATDGIILDTVAPVVRAPTHAFVQDSQVATGRVPVRVSWSATDAVGVASYDVQQTVDAGVTWTTVVSSTTSTSTTLSLGGTYTYQYRVQATDRAGNVGASAPGASFKLRAYQENSSGVTYTGAWTRTASSDSYGGYVKSATAYDARARLTFTGRSVAFLAPRGPTMGSAYVYIDGSRVATINLYATTAKGRNVAFIKSFTTSGSHTIEIRVIGTSGHPRVSVDGFILLN